jgi:hypothetical protein
MDTAHPEIPAQISIDVIALDKTGQIILVADVRGSKTVKRTIQQFTSYLKAAKTVVPFAMLVDLETIEIARWDKEDWSESICSLKTAKIFSFYTNDFGKKTIYGDYLEALVESWLRDLAYHWKSKTPPASEALAAIGLLQQLEDGSTKRGVEIAGDTVLRDEFSDEYLYRA